MKCDILSPAPPNSKALICVLLKIFFQVADQQEYSYWFSSTDLRGKIVCSCQNGCLLLASYVAVVRAFGTLYQMYGLMRELGWLLSEQHFCLQVVEVVTKSCVCCPSVSWFQ